MTNFIDAKQKSFAKINPWNDIGMGNVYGHQEKWIKAKKKYFQALYPDFAVSTACVSCHNAHPRSPKKDFKLNDVMGGIVLTIPVE